MDEDELQCYICKRYFTHTTNKKSHICKGASVKFPLLQYALHYTHEMIDQVELGIIPMYNESTALFGNDILATEVQHDFKRGRALTPPYGRMYGRKYMGPFKQEIPNIFLQGLKDSAQRLTRAKMLENLRGRHSSRLDVSSENEILQAITVLLAKQSKDKTISLSTSSRGIVEPYNTTIHQILN